MKSLEIVNIYHGNIVLESFKYNFYKKNWVLSDFFNSSLYKEKEQE